LARAASNAVFPLAVHSGSDHVDDLCAQLADLVSDKTASCSTVEHQLSGLAASATVLHRKLVDEESLRRQWNEALEDAEKDLVQHSEASSYSSNHSSSHRAPHHAHHHQGFQTGSPAGNQDSKREYDVAKASYKAATYVTKLRESWQHLLRDRAARSKPTN
jgi:hypothetical protein